MSNIDILKKLVEGREDRQEYSFEGLDAPITLRPLTSGELVELQALEKKGMAATMKIKNFAALTPQERRKKAREQVQDLESKLDFGELRRAAAEVKYRAIHYSAEIPEELVRELPARLVDDIFEKVMEISQVTEGDLDMLQDFHRLRRGEGPVGDT